jgi:hypothetical protein
MNANSNKLEPLDLSCRSTSTFSISIRSIIFFVTVLYACTTIFTPKIDIGIAPVYFFEPVFLAMVIYLFKKNKLHFSTNIEKTYLLFSILTVFTYLEGPLITGIFDVKPALLLLKFTIFVMMIPVVRYLNGTVSDQVFIRILHSQFLFVLLSGLYVVFNMLVNPISLGDMIWSYSPAYRLIGFTGQAIGIDGLNAIGNTSVQMGVYTGFLFLISMSLFVHLKKPMYLWWSLIMFFGSLLTYSRSGLLVIFFGILYLLIDKAKNKRVIRLFAGAVTALFVFSLYVDLFELITSFGSLGKLVETSGVQDGSAQQRVAYVSMAKDYVLDHPYALLFGTGYGESYTMSLIGTPHLESLIFTTLFQSGIFVVLILMAHFFYLWKYASQYSRVIGTNVYGAVLYGCKIYIPGLLLANLVGGNSLQTDFMAPFFYFIFGVCMYRLQQSCNRIKLH